MGDNVTLYSLTQAFNIYSKSISRNIIAQFYHSHIAATLPPCSPTHHDPPYRLENIALRRARV